MRLRLGLLANGEDAAELDFALPEGRWAVAFDADGRADESAVAEHHVRVRRKSALILRKVAEIMNAVAQAPALAEAPPAEEPALAERAPGEGTELAE